MQASDVRGWLHKQENPAPMKIPSRFHIGETFDDLRLVEQSTIQKPGVLRFQPASNTEQMVAKIGPVTWFHLLWSFAREVAFFPRSHKFGALCCN